MTPVIRNVSRRAFLKSGLASAAGLTLGLSLPLRAGNDGPGKTTLNHDVRGAAFAPNAFVRIGVDGTVTVFSKHLEMGQGVYTGLATLVAEELDAAWAQVRVVGAPANAEIYNNLFWGNVQGTGGSTSIANAYTQMRRAGAAARAMLAAAAARQWGVPVRTVTVCEGRIRAGERTAGFGDFAELAAQETVPTEPRLKTPQQFRFIGKDNILPRKDTAAKIDGTAVYTQDIRLPGMKTAVVAHPPRFGAKLKAVDAVDAMKVKGVFKVVPIATGVAVIADNFWHAKQGRAALAIEWDESAAYRADSDALLAEYRALANTPGVHAGSAGDAVTAMRTADHVLEREFYVPYLAHAAMEPLNCVVRLNQDGAEIWNGEQLHTVDQYAVAALAGVPVENVTFTMLLAGGSFGRRANPHSDYIKEAVAVAKAAHTHDPIKLVWDREDDTRGGYYRPAFLHRIRVGLDARRQPIAWQHRMVGQSVAEGTTFEAMLVRDRVDQLSVEGANNMPYRLANRVFELHSPSSPVPVQWWRSVGSTHTAFAVEVMVDELAAAAGEDAVAFRRRLLVGHPRHLAVLNLAAEQGHWGEPLPPGRGRGVAVHESFNTCVAQVVEVTVDGAAFRVDKVTIAVDCGVAVNPDVVRAQMEGGMAYGLAAALVSEITLTDGKVDQSNFHDYQVLRMDQMPDVQVHIVPSAAAPTGVGEPATPVIAPAVANALYAATGQRLRRLPLRLGYS